MSNMYYLKSMISFKNLSRHNGIQKAINRVYKEHLYNKISISDYTEFLEKIKIPIMDLIKKQTNDNIKYQMAMLV